MPTNRRKEVKKSKEIDINSGRIPHFPINVVRNSLYSFRFQNRINPEVSRRIRIITIVDASVTEYRYRITGWLLLDVISVNSIHAVARCPSISNASMNQICSFFICMLLQVVGNWNDRE